MPITFCLIPQDIYSKPGAPEIASLLRSLVFDEYVDNDDIYLDVAYVTGHHRPGVSSTTTVSEAAEELDELDDDALVSISVENIRGNKLVPEIFENADQTNLSLMGLLAVRTYESPYPLLDSEQRYTITCTKCGKTAPYGDWSRWMQGCCPSCNYCDELYNLRFSPRVEFASFVLEIADLDFEGPPRTSVESGFIELVNETIGIDLKPVWYRM